MKLLSKAAAALLCAVGISAQASTTSVTATLTDSDSSVWSSCTWTAVVSSPVPPTISGVAVPADQLRAGGSCSSSGVLSATMLDTSSVQQAGVTWTFTITPNASVVSPSVVSGVAVTGASISLSAALSAGIKAPRFPAGTKAYGYSDVEVSSPVLGDTYFNTANVCGGTSLRQYSNAGWACGGSGGSSSSASNPAIPSGALADYKFLDATGTTVSDSTSNHNDGTANANTTWVANGLDFADPSVTTKAAAAVTLPAALNATQTILLVTYEKPIQKTLMAGNFQLLIGSTQSSGMNLTAGYINPTGNFEGGYSLSTFTAGVSNTAATNTFSGLHALAFVCGTGISSNNDHLYIDGVEVNYKVQGHSCGAQTSGNLVIGNPGISPWASGGQMSATAYRAIFWSTQLTPAQIAAASLAALQEVETRGVAPTPPLFQSVGVPTLHCIGDSITFGFPALTPFCSSLTLTNQPTYTINNWGIPSVSAKALSIAEPNRVAPLCRSVSGVPPTAIFLAGTNDLAVTGNNYQTPQLVWGSNASEISTLKTAGCKVLVGTMLSRTGSGSNGSTMDVNKDGLDALILGNWKISGADGVIDYAADPNLGADNAYSNLTWFQADGTHPTQAGQTRMGVIASNSLNYYYSQYSTANPHVITASGTLASADVAVSIGTLSGAVALVMPDCTGPSGAVYTITNPQAAQAVTIAGGASQPINGLSSAITIANNATVTLTDVANPKTTSGCQWALK